MNRCPSPDALRRLLAEQLTGAETDAVEAHLQSCTACQQHLERLTTSETAEDFLHRIRQEPPAVIRPPQSAQAEPTTVDAAPPIQLARALAPTGVRELQPLLRQRLLFITVVTWIATAIYAMSVLPLFPDLGNAVFFSLLLGVTSTLAVLLWRHPQMSMDWLRCLEVILFASMGLFFLAGQIRCHSWGWYSRMAAGDWQGVWLLARAFSFGWYALIVLYGVLIPNTWRRCAVVVGAMALCPVLANATAGLWDTAVEPRLHVMFVVECAVNVSLAASLAIYGAHRIETLRVQAAQARQLGPYQLKERLGAGGMGEVYLAEHVLLRRPCAVKLIRPERAGDPQFLRRFEREVQVTATLSHPNTVEVFDYGHADDGTFYYVMEYLPGLNLEELVQRHGPLPAPRVIHLLRQVCGALREAHVIGLVHRDIKPSNVLVCERGGVVDVAKLLDFGLVRAPRHAEMGQTLTQEGTLAGTPAYMSPEQAAGQMDVDARSDLYSLGAVAYFLLTGQPPFVRPTAVQTLAAHLSEPVTPPSALRPGLSADLEAVVLRCLDKEPARRFPTAEALDQALRRCVEATAS
jgi:serine/threonine-protein kinase